MTTHTISNITTQSSTWKFKDTIWSMGVYGATVGAGVLFLPVEIGIRGPLVYLLLVILSLPLSMIPHMLICRVFMREEKTTDKALPLFNSFFDTKGKKAIKVFYCFSNFPVTLVYGISLVNAISNYCVTHLHIPGINRAVLSFVVVAILFLLLSRGRDKVVSMMSVLVLPFALTVTLIAAFQIPQWNIANVSQVIRDTYQQPMGGSLKNIWLTIPLITFAFCSVPLMSPLASYYRENGHGGEKKSVMVIRVAYISIYISILFFVTSCLLSIPHDVFVLAKSQNLNVLSVLQKDNSNLVLFYIAPFIAIIGMTKSFLGICLSVAETFALMVSEAIGEKGDQPKRKGKRIAWLIMFAISYVVVYINPDVIDLIEKFCGPLQAIFLFLIPVYLIYSRSALKSLRGVRPAIVLTGGLLTVSALFYSMV